jgi:hypothetical protein
MPGLNVSARHPMVPFTPELLAQLANAGFRPPSAMNMPGLHVSAPPPTPGFNVGGDGIAGLGAGLGMGLNALKDFLTGFRGDPAASAMYGAPRGPIPADVVARGVWQGGGT